MSSRTPGRGQRRPLFKSVEFINPPSASSDGERSCSSSSGSSGSSSPAAEAEDPWLIQTSGEGEDVVQRHERRPNHITYQAFIRRNEDFTPILDYRARLWLPSLGKANKVPRKPVAGQFDD